MRLFLNDGPDADGKLRLIARAEGDGVMGDALVTAWPGETFAGVPYAALLALVQAQGWADLPGDGPDAAAARLSVAIAAYCARFPDAFVPMPMCISDGYRAQVMFDAIEAGEPIPSNLDWYSHLPPGAVA